MSKQGTIPLMNNMVRKGFSSKLKSDGTFVFSDLNGKIFVYKDTNKIAEKDYYEVTRNCLFDREKEIYALGHNDTLNNLEINKLDKSANKIETFVLGNINISPGTLSFSPEGFVFFGDDDANGRSLNPDFSTKFTFPLEDDNGNRRDSRFTAADKNNNSYYCHGRAMQKRDINGNQIWIYDSFVFHGGFGDNPQACEIYKDYIFVIASSRDRLIKINRFTGNVDQFIALSETPTDLSIDLNGNIYIGFSDGTIRKYNHEDLTSSFFAGIGGNNIFLASDTEGNLYAATNTLVKKIVKLDTDGNTIFTFNTATQTTSINAYPGILSLYFD